MTFRGIQCLQTSMYSFEVVGATRRFCVRYVFAQDCEQLCLQSQTLCVASIASFGMAMEHQEVLEVPNGKRTFLESFVAAILCVRTGCSEVDAYRAKATESLPAFCGGPIAEFCAVVTLGHALQHQLRHGSRTFHRCYSFASRNAVMSECPCDVLSRCNH